MNTGANQAISKASMSGEPASTDRQLTPKAMRFKLPSRQRLIASVASIVILSLALFVLWFGQGLSQMPDDTVTVREISVSAPPPPPPPPPVVQQQAVQTPITLQIEGAGPSIQMAEIDQNIEIDKPDMPELAPQNTQWQSLEVDWDAFDLNELDGFPTLLTMLRVKFPKSLSRKGVKTVLVKLDVVIDQQGKVSLVKIISNPHPELEGEIQKLVSNSKFTAPQKDGQPARARFVWPVEIGS